MGTPTVQLDPEEPAGPIDIFLPPYPAGRLRPAPVSSEGRLLEANGLYQFADEDAVVPYDDVYGLG